MTAFWQNLFIFLRTAPRITRYFASGRWRIGGAGKAAAGRPAGDGFLGICAASSEEQGTDDYIIECLKELNLPQVRIDFSYESRDNFQERFLRRLLNEKFRVCLHLVQPPLQAGKMRVSAQARDNWRAFVAEILEAYGRELELIEIGSTCNRRKWSGYSLASYLTAWQIAYEVASVRKCSLAAPNVTDFEPVYNIAVLSGMKRRNILPAVHSDNLFVERATEPEAYDHKIAGKLFAGMLKFDLVRKARVLNDIAVMFGVPKTICSHVSWSLRRIERFLENTEEKQADYLARYCCLAAASGALARVYWGPLIGQREGLIDDGTTEFPEIPHVTYYARSLGNVQEYRKRPAYFALQTINRFIAGAEYVRKIPSERGLEIHEFCSPEGWVHVAWTMNGLRALMNECYQPGILDGAKIYSRDGAMLETAPLMISESPVYLIWRGLQASPAEAIINPSGLSAPLKNIRFACLNGRKYDFVVRDGYSGICLTGGEDLVFNQIARLKNGAAAADFEIIRDARNRVWRLPAGKTVIIKLFRPPALFRRVFSRRKGDKALRSWNGANELLRRGIFTPLPVAFFHHAEKPMSSDGWYVCEDFKESFSVRSAFNALSAGADKFEGISDQELYNQIALFIRKMHDRGVYFRDLSAGNLLFRIRGHKATEFALIDTARAKFYYRGLNLRQRLCDLMRICHPLCWRGRRIFLSTYMGLIGRRYRAWMNIPFHYYDFKHWMKGKFRRWRR